MIIFSQYILRIFVPSSKKLLHEPMLTKIYVCKQSTRGPFDKHVLTLIPAWISNHMPCNVWDKITYPFLNFNGCTVEV